jgi:hypothetical protein
MFSAPRNRFWGPNPEDGRTRPRLRPRAACQRPSFRSQLLTKHASCCENPFTFRRGPFSKPARGLRAVAERLDSSLTRNVRELVCVVAFGEADCEPRVVLAPDKQSMFDQRRDATIILSGILGHQYIGTGHHGCLSHLRGRLYRPEEWRIPSNIDSERRFNLKQGLK